MRSGAGWFDKKWPIFYHRPVAELRRDPVSGNWVVSGYRTVKTSSVGDCPFCPGNENLVPKPIREMRGPDGEWLVRCFPAANPVFVIEVEENKKAEGMYDKMGNVGAHEVIVENRAHTKTLSMFTEEELSLVIDMYIDRIADLKKDRRFKYVHSFKNHGELTGSYIFHPHSHVLATPTLPQRIESEISNCRKHFIRKERCLFCDIAGQEIRQNKRIVSVNPHFVTLCPFATRFPYETWILPRQHDPTFETSVDRSVKRELVSTLLDTIKRVEKLTNAYTIAFHTSPNMERASYPDDDLPISDYFHWHIEILPRDFRSSKYKGEDQFYAVSVTPEEAATSLRAQKV
jgi:UDPglucose--hexose-1-phosphate uridylyltransferase